jgi:hypothetical protein
MEPFEIPPEKNSTLIIENRPFDPFNGLRAYRNRPH